MDNDKGKYKLICIVNDNMDITHTLKSGSLEDIDKYIYDRKINNDDELYHELDFWFGNATYSFKIIYKYKGLKEKKIVYYDDLRKINNLIAIEEITLNYFKNSEYHNYFIKTYVKPLLNIDNNNKIKSYANDLYNNRNNKDKFERLLYSLISKSIGDGIYDRKIYYTKLRDMYTDFKYFNKEYQVPSIYDEIVEIYDEKTKNMNYNTIKINKK